MFKWLCILIVAVSLFACKGGKRSLDGSEPVKADDFFAAFNPLTLPATFSDTNLTRKADTTGISYDVLNQFVADSALQKAAGKDHKKLAIHPAGIISKTNELYLLITFTQNKKTKLVAFVFDKEKKFKSSVELISNKSDDGYVHAVGITKEPTFIVGREKLTGDNQLMYSRQGYAFNNDAGSFIVVLNDSNEDLKKQNEILNPLDTLARKSKYSGDYIQDKKNFISIRDGRKDNSYRFFIHFEKNNGECIGELKGELSMVGENKAIFKESGDPCVIDFSFSGTSVKVKEQGSCGNHRGIRCYFNDEYRKKKEPKKSEKKKTK